MGLAPIALKPQDKYPTVRGWQENPRQTWNAAPPNANIGLLTGEPSDGFIVIDVDDPRALPNLFELSIRELRHRTLVVKTGSGLHIYARQEDVPSQRLPNGAGDLQANGKQVVAPPSIHPSGATYRFISYTWSIASLDELHPTFGSKSEQAERTEAATQRAPPCVEASEPDVSSAPSTLVRRVEAFVTEQAPRFRRKVAALREDRVRDRSGAEFMLAKGMAEADFSLDEIRKILASWGPKARERGSHYIHLTASRAMRYV